jgi:hypothetical protein
MELLEFAKQLKWGTYGPGAVDAYRENGTPLPPLVQRPLGELEDAHLLAILEHVSPDSHGPETALMVQGAIRLILDDRRRNG